MRFRQMKKMGMVAAVLALGSCGSMTKLGTGGRGGSSDGTPVGDPTVEKSTGQAPAVAAALTLEVKDGPAVDKKFGKKLDPFFKPLCLTRNSAYLPSILTDEFAGIRYIKPAGMFEQWNSKKADDGTTLQAGWAVKVFAGVTGTAFPDFSKLQATATVIDRPDIQGAAAPGGQTRNFAMRSETSFNMPVARTLQFQLRGRAVARLLIDDKVVLTTAVAAGNANPVAVTVDAPLAAGQHTAAVEYVNGNLAPIFELLMRFAGEMTYGPPVANGAVPFSVRQAKEATNKPAEDPNVMRSPYWPQVAGSENIAKCDPALFVDSHQGMGEEAYADAAGFLRIREQESWSLQAQHPESESEQYWVMPTSMSGNAFGAVSMGAGQLAVTFSGGQRSTLSLTDILADQDFTNPQFTLLGVGTKNANGKDYGVISVAALGENEQGILTLFYEPIANHFNIELRPFPSGWDKDLKAVGMVGGKALLQVGSKLWLASIDGANVQPVEVGVDVKMSRMQGDFWMILGSGNELIYTTIAALRDTVEEKVEAAAELLEAKSLSAEKISLGESQVEDIKFVWLDSLKQFWVLKGSDIALLTPKNAPAMILNPPDGKLYIAEPDKLAGISLTAGGKALGDIAVAAVAPLRGKVSTEENFVQLEIKLKAGGSTVALIPKSIITGVGYGDEKAPDQKGPVVGPKPTAAPGPVVSYMKDIAPFIQRSCLGAGCHSRPNPAAGAPLENKMDLQLKIVSVMGNAGPNGRMPLGGRQRLSADELKKLDDWSKGGFAD